MDLSQNSVALADEINYSSYMGKSTGSGALAVWTHHLTDTEWFDSFHSGPYRGPAVKMQAGVPIAQMYEEASARGFTIVGGDCPVRYSLMDTYAFRRTHV